MRNSSELSDTLDNNAESGSDDGWVLYYSSEGYPYYYNKVTGESVWAQLETTLENKDSTLKPDNDEVEGSSSDVETGSSQSSNETGYSSEEDRLMEVEFRQYLKTADGLAAVQHQKRRIERKLESKRRKSSRKPSVSNTPFEFVASWFTRKLQESYRSGAKLNMDHNDDKNNIIHNSIRFKLHPSEHEYSDDEEDVNERLEFLRWKEKDEKSRGFDVASPVKQQVVDIENGVDAVIRERDISLRMASDEIGSQSRSHSRSGSSGSSIDSDDSDLKIIEEPDFPPWLTQALTPTALYTGASTLIRTAVLPSVIVTLRTVSNGVYSLLSLTTRQTIRLATWSGLDSALKKLVESEEPDILQNVDRQLLSVGPEINNVQGVHSVRDVQHDEELAVKIGTVCTTSTSQFVL